MADATDSKSVALYGRVGSTPTSGTIPSYQPSLSSPVFQRLVPSFQRQDKVLESQAMSLSRTCLFISVLLLPAAWTPATAQDTLRLTRDDGAQPGQTSVLTLQLRDLEGTALDSGTEPRREIRSLTITVEPRGSATDVESIDFETAGLTAGLPVRFETRFNDAGKYSWIISFDEPLQALPEFRAVARVLVKLSPTATPQTGFGLRLNADTTALGNADGTVLETAGNGDLTLVNGFITIVEACTAGERLCLLGDRFHLTIAWDDNRGNQGVGRPVQLTDETGYFWFFGPGNVEVVIKALDGRALNEYFWIFYGSLSDVEYTLTVTDSETGEVKEYSNPQGNFASVGDTRAFFGGP